MGSLKQIKQTITYKVPNWDHCNLMDPNMNVTIEKCRFCTYDKKHGYFCTLYNMPLGMADVNHVVKTPGCKKATAGSNVEINDAPSTSALNTQPGSAPAVDPKKLIKLAIEGYTKARADLLAQGYPASIADKLAKDYMIGGK